MITPKFSLTQDEGYVIVTIYAPYVKAQDVDISIADKVFSFYCKPYFLRLTFEYTLAEDESECASYDANSREFVVKLPKKTRGEVFADLALLTKLLAPPKNSGSSHRLVEEISSQEPDSDDFSDSDDDGNQWYVEQSLDEVGQSNADSEVGYGFGGKVTGVWSSLREHAGDLLDIQEPDTLSLEQRKSIKTSHEDSDFSEDHYLADMYDNPDVEAILKYVPAYSKPDYNIDEHLKQNTERMLALPRRRYNLSKTQKRVSYLELVDVIYSYCYNCRVTLGEENVECPWNIRKLSAPLSNLVSYTDLRDVVLSCIRRSLCYPLVRNWDVAVAVLRDTQQVLAGGKQVALLCLLDIHRMFSACDPYYVLNDLYITDLCVWIQCASDKKVRSLSAAIDGVNLSKSDVELDLPILEQAAAMALASNDDDLRNIDSSSSSSSHRLDERQPTDGDHSESHSSSDDGSSSQDDDDSSSEYESDSSDSSISPAHLESSRLAVVPEHSIVEVSQCSPSASLSGDEPSCRCGTACCTAECRMAAVQRCLSDLHLSTAKPQGHRVLIEELP